jgi:3-hydroxyisobutyrate dehydrogenase
MTDQPLTIAHLGTGTMGFPIAKNLASAGHDLRAWNRSRDKAAPLSQLGVTVADTPSDAVEGADLVITMLYDAASVADTIKQASKALKPGAIWVQLSTVGVAGEQRLAELATELGLRYVDAPVLGTKKPAEDGKLTILASGPQDTREACQPIFDVIGARTIWVGSAGAGSRLKLVANAWVLTVLEGIAESLSLARGLGLDPALFLEAISGGAMDAPYVQLKGNAMLASDWTPSFALSGVTKDAELIVQAGTDAGVEMAFTRTALGFLRQAIADGHGDKDMAAIYLAHVPRS